MSTELDLPSDNSALYEGISHLIAATVAQVQQTTPEQIQPKFRTIDLIQNQEHLTAKLTDLLSPHADLKRLQQLLSGVLQQLLTPQFFETPAYPDLLSQIKHLIASSRGLSLPTAAPSRQTVRRDAPSGRGFDPPSAIAILLLDAENINLTEPAEAWIAQFCQYPLQTKIAFGNWRKLGNRDQALHQRGYQMIHVPPGKNGTDLKMTALGASLLVFAPKAKEVVVCSSDGDLESLRQILSTQGLRVHQVRCRNSKLTLVDGQFQVSEVFPLPPSVEVPSLIEGLEFLQDRVATDPNGVPFSQLSSAFYEYYKVPLRQFANQHGFKQGPKAFLEARPEFSLMHCEADQQLHVFLVDQLAATPMQFVEREAHDFTPSILELISKKILQRLIQEQLTARIPVGMVASRFSQQYGQSIKSILKEHALGQNLPNFFRTVEGIQVEWDERQQCWCLSLDH